MTRYVTGFVLLVFACIGARNAVAADEYPNRLIRVIVPYAAGGGTDIVARLVAKGLSEDLKVSAIVENKPGADGIIGVETVTKSPNDGYTVLITTMAMALNPSIHRKLAYDPVKDLRAVARIVDLPFVVVVNGAEPAKDLMSLVQQFKSDKSALIATGGTTTTVFGELFKMAAGLDLTFVPYQGSAPAALSVVKKETQVYVTDLPTVAEFVRSKMLRAVAVSSDSRSKLLPDIPTAKESGLKDFVATSWFGAFVPAGTPDPIVDKLNVAINRVTSRPEVIERLASYGAEVVTSDPASFQEYVGKEVTRWRDVVTKSGMDVND